MAKKLNTTESAALRKIIDAYFKDIEKKGLPYEPLRKISPIGLKLFSRTITKEQDRKLRELAEKTGRKISELAREAAEGYLEV
ncbi:MAG: ribbon-helix-helix domain-containing protein [Candidatus Omnitrophota bacterium]|nr:ribbon-helix-helix domain-containing protein [Candidatus Omnitrophota bacterium]